VSFDTLHLQVVTDDVHSVPKEITVSAGGASDTVRLPPLPTSRVRGTVTDVPLHVPPLTGSTVRMTVDAVQLRDTVDFASQSPVALPIGIAEWGIAGVGVAPAPAALPSTCRGDLLTVDGAPLWVEVTGTSMAALARLPLTLTPCGADASGVALGQGDHIVRSVPGAVSGIDIDQLALASASGGGAAHITGAGQLTGPTGGTTPVATVVHQSTTVIQVSIAGVPIAGAPFALVLGQSLNGGWQASAGRRVLPPLTLIDGFANGWSVDPQQVATATHAGILTVTLRWTPQRRVNVAVLVSAVAIVVCILLAIVPWARRRRRGVVESETDEDAMGIPLATFESADGKVPMSPELVRPAFDRTEPASGPLSVITAGVVAVAALAIASLPTGLIVGIATFVVLRRPTARVWLGLAAVGCLAGAGAYITIMQLVDPTRSTGGWPTGFGVATGLAWGAVLFLAADVAVELVFRLRDGRSTSVGPRAERG
jgi:hypothetical protein